MNTTKPTRERNQKEPERTEFPSRLGDLNFSTFFIEPNHWCALFGSKDNNNANI